MRKNKLLLLLVLLMTAATGAWADETPKVVFEEHFVSEPTDPTAVGFYEFINFEEGDDHEVDNGELSIFNSDGTLDINNWKRRAIKFRNLPLGEGKTYRLEFKLKGSTRFEDGINDGDDRPFCKASAQLLQGVEGHDISLLDSDGNEQRGEFENFDESNYKSYSMTFVFASEQKQKDTYALNNQGELAEKYYLSLSIFNPGFFYLKDVVLYEIPSAASGYTVSLKDGVKDADKWTISPNPAEEGQTVTLQYTGRLKVKSVTATTDAKPAAPSVPDGALSGKFSVSDTKQVYFSKGNLQATYNGSNWSWAFAEHQWDYIGNAAGNTKVTASSPYISENATVDLFGWVGAACAWTGAAQYGISNVKQAAQYGYVEGEALKSDWGTLAITNGGNTANFGWRTLTAGDDSGEWEYLFKTRTTPSGVRYAHATVNSVPGLVLLPDDWSTDYYSLNKVNDANGTDYTDNVISSSDWTSKLEAHGAVFLPAGGYRNGAEVSDAGVQGTYWSSTSSSTKTSALGFFFKSARFGGDTQNFTRNRGHSVRLVREVATSDAGAPAAGNIVDLSTLTEAYEAQTLDILTGTTSQLITIADGATVTLKDATVNNQIACLGNATIILADGSTNTVTATNEKAAIKIGGPGTTLTITGSGSLTAQGGLEAAGIGTDRNEDGELSFGNIVINGGTVTATGGKEGAGIGTGLADGQYASASITCGDITINGGTVTAIGGLYGAGIGTGPTMSDGGSASITCGDITINGGTVTATGGDYGPGIGTGVFLKYGSESASNGCGAITIGAGVTSVTATKGGSYSPNSIGKGYASGGTQNFGTITIGGDATTYAAGVTASPFTYTPSN